MNRNHVIAIMGLAFILGAGNAQAEDFDFDVTMTVIGNAEVQTPDVFLQDMPLPTEALDNTEDSANLDHNLINTARARRQAGLNIAAEMAGDIQDSVNATAEASSRAEEVRPDVPDDLPGPPGG